MDGMTDGATFTDESSVQSGGGADPFGGGSHVISWPREVTVGQLQDEIAQELGEEVRIAVALPTDGDGIDHPINDQHPLQIFVTPPSVELASVQKLVASHRPDPYYGMSSDDVRQAQLEEKIRSGAELSLREMSEALRMLVR